MATPSPPKPYETRTATPPLASSFMSSTAGATPSVGAAAGAASSALTSGLTSPSSALTVSGANRGVYGTAAGLNGVGSGYSAYSNSGVGAGYGASSLYGNTNSMYGANSYGTGYGSSYSSPYSSYGGSGYGSSYGSGYGSAYGGAYGSGYGSSYGGGYGSTGYGGYGGGYGSAYGSGYGSGYGMGGYGASPYGGGLMGPGGPVDPNNPLGPNKLLNGGQNLLNGVQTSVQSFGRISHLLQMSFEALHMSFMSMVNLLGNVSFLRQEMYGIGKTFTTLRFLQLIYLKARKLLNTLLGIPMPVRPPPSGPPVFQTVMGPNGVPMQIPIPNATHSTMNDAWADAESPWAWIPMCLTLAVGWWLLRVLWRRVSAAVWPPTPEQLAAAQSAAAAEQQQAAIAAAAANMPPGMTITTVNGPNGPVQVYMPIPPQQPTANGQPQQPLGFDANGFPIYAPPQVNAYPQQTIAGAQPQSQSQQPFTPEQAAYLQSVHNQFMQSQAQNSTAAAGTSGTAASTATVAAATSAGANAAAPVSVPPVRPIALPVASASGGGTTDYQTLMAAGATVNPGSAPVPRT